MLMQAKIQFSEFTLFLSFFGEAHIYAILLISKIFHIRMHTEAIYEVEHDILIRPLHFLHRYSRIL